MNTVRHLQQLVEIVQQLVEILMRSRDRCVSLSGTAGELAVLEAKALACATAEILHQHAIAAFGVSAGILQVLCKGCRLSLCWLSLCPPLLAHVLRRVLCAAVVMVAAPLRPTATPGPGVFAIMSSRAKPPSAVSGHCLELLFSRRAK